MSEWMIQDRLVIAYVVMGLMTFGVIATILYARRKAQKKYRTRNRRFKQNSGKDDR